jgi:FixJ family two-component response regulator
MDAAANAQTRASCGSINIHYDRIRACRTRFRYTNPQPLSVALMADASKSQRSVAGDSNIASNSEMAPKPPIVFVLDDDPNVREALARLLSSVGLRVSSFGCAAEFRSAKGPGTPSCLILDLQLPDMSGLELQRELGQIDGPPIVFISGHGDIPSSVRAIKSGAIEFLPKPFTGEELLEAVEKAIAQDRKARQNRGELAKLQKAYTLLSAREREVLPLIVAGLTNKQSAERLGIAEITLQVHRAQIMRKMAARSVPDLVRMASKLEVNKR